MADRLPIVFASDFGAGSEWVGMCHAVIAAIAPETRVIDLAHALPQFDVAGAGNVLRESMAYAPVCVGLFVVDPGVGMARRAIVARAGRGDLLIGPDNGLLPLGAERIGGIAEARELTSADLRPASPPSATFHARDIFAPAAARLSVGFPFARAGAEIDPASLVRAHLPAPAVRHGHITCVATDVDVFGNVRLSVRPEALVDAGLDAESAVWVMASGGEIAAHRAKTYGELELGRAGLIVDSFGWLCLCVNRGSAAHKLGVVRGATIELTARP